MKYSDIKASVLAQFAVEGGNKFVPFIVGKPGGGKSSCARAIANELAKEHGIEEDRIIEFNPSLREPSDILGLPDLSGECSRWVPPKEFYDIRKGTGPAVLIIEELSDATMDMQNPLCRIILDRHAGQMPLTEELYIIASGNRTEDKSGASRLSTKLANRMRTLQFDENLPDWVAWAQDNNINPAIVGFLSWKPNLLSDFDPSRSCNPTPRSWEDVSRIPMTLTKTVYREHVAGAVGEGAAAEFTGFLQIMNNLPDYDKVRKDPEHADIPKDPATMYALCIRISEDIDGKSAGNFFKYSARLKPEFEVLILKTIKKAKGKAAVVKLASYRDRMLANAKYILGDLK